MNTPVITPHSKEQEAQLLAFAAKLGLTVNRVNEEEELDAALRHAMLEGEEESGGRNEELDGFLKPLGNKFLYRYCFPCFYQFFYLKKTLLCATYY